MDLRIGHRYHDTMDAVTSRIKQGRPIGEAGAMAIAALYQSPGYDGKVFATMASGMDVDPLEVASAIQYNLASKRTWEDNEVTYRELAALAVWCLEQLADQIAMDES